MERNKGKKRLEWDLSVKDVSKEDNKSKVKRNPLQNKKPEVAPKEEPNEEPSTF